ncbi:SET domain-containing protein 9 [Mortierella alpina]|nr:SET domain-containing protein 9 [Mortierella alpina]
MRDFIHRFYPYQALRLMLQRWRPAHRLGSSPSSASLVSPSTRSALSPKAATAEPFDPVKARSQLVSYFRALKQAQATLATPATASNKVDIGQLQRLRQSISHNEFGFHLEVAPSEIPTAGLGLFLRNGSIPTSGTIVAMYPGTLYRPGEAIFFNSIQNRYILKCNDGVYVDGKAKGLSGSIYRSNDRRDNYPGTVPSADTTWMMDWPLALSEQISDPVSAAVPETKHQQQQEQPPAQGMSTAILRNPLAVGQIVNNGTRAHPPNVRYQELDLRTRDCALELQEFLPNIWYSDDWHAHDHDHDNNEREVVDNNEGTPSKVDWSHRSLSDLDHLRTVVLVTTRPIAQDEELFSTYIE